MFSLPRACRPRKDTGNGSLTDEHPDDDPKAEIGQINDKVLSLLRSVPLFQGLTDDVVPTLLSGATVRQAEDGAILFLQGDKAHQFYVLLDGWVKLYRMTEDGNQALVTVVAAGETFAEAAVFASGQFPVCAEAVGRVTTLVISRKAFIKSLASDPNIAVAMLASLSLRLRHLVERIEHLQVRSAPQRLADFLVRLSAPSREPATVGLPFAKSLVAQRLGMRPETLSRALAVLRREGVVVNGGQVTIVDRERLQAYSEAPRSREPAKRARFTTRP